MYHKLELWNCFVHKHLLVDFQKGLTHISGLNGKGKSLIPEMAEFCLWGSKALRGKSEDYKGMSATLDFSIKRVVYRVERTITSATLFSGSEKIATGTKPVNARIQELFGYSYEVFKTTNVARQGEIERMGNMLPTERKKLVDETIGLSRIDELTIWVKTQYADLPGQIKTLQAIIQDPEPEPAPPAAPQPDMPALQAQLAVYNANVSYLADPVAPTKHQLSDSYAALQEQQQARVHALGEKAGIERVLTSFPPLPTGVPILHERDSERQELSDSSQRYREALGQATTLRKALQGVPLNSTVTDAALVAAEKIIRDRGRIVERDRIRSQQVEYNCPKCQHQWHDADPRLADYVDLPEVRPELIYNSKQIEELRKINNYQDTRKTLKSGLEAVELVLAANADHSGLITDIDSGRHVVERYQELLRGEEKRKQLLQQLAGIDVPEDASVTLLEIEAYRQALLKWGDAIEKQKIARGLLEKLPTDMPAVYQKADELNHSWLSYTFQKTAWEKAVQTHNGYVERLISLQAELEDWKAALEAITLLRQRIKGYLLPSLNKVASQLVNIMSNGWLPWVVVNDDFDIIVGGQPINTLTGGGKAITNLALRIGLGQVLTNSVFSSLTIDEGDAGVDKEKAPMITEALKKLTGTIQQIIVISHKEGLVADHRIEL